MYSIDNNEWKLTGGKTEHNNVGNYGEKKEDPSENHYPHSKSNIGVWHDYINYNIWSFGGIGTQGMFYNFI